MLNKINQVMVKNSESHILYSNSVDDEFRISVALPSSYDSTQIKYPVLYILDSNIFFGLLVDTVRLLQYGNEIPDLIIVGIGYPNDDEHMVLRNRDYLPTFNKASEKSGKAKLFLEFLINELVPDIRKEYRVNENDSTLVGDSYSGLFALYTLFNSPKSFNRYIIGSPSIYWDDRVMLDIEEKYSSTHKELEAKVFLSVGELEAVYEPEFARMVGNVEEISKVLHSRKYSGLELKTHIFEGETHLSVIPATFSRGLRGVFN